MGHIHKHTYVRSVLFHLDKHKFADWLFCLPVSLFYSNLTVTHRLVGPVVNAAENRPHGKNRHKKSNSVQNRSRRNLLQREGSLNKVKND